MPFAIKPEVRDPRARTFTFTAQKTMYGGKHRRQLAQAMRKKSLIDVTEPRFQIPSNHDVMAFVRQANPFAHSDVGSVLLALGKTIPGAHAYCPSYASHAYVVLHTDQNQIFAIAFGQRGLAFRLAEAAHAAALADGGKRAAEVGQTWIRFDLWELNASAGARERLRYWCVRALSDAVLGAS